MCVVTNIIVLVFQRFGQGRHCVLRRRADIAQGFSGEISHRLIFVLQFLNQCGDFGFGRCINFRRSLAIGRQDKYRKCNDKQNALKELGFSVPTGDFFDTIYVDSNPEQQQAIREAALENEINLRYFEDGRAGISMD